MRISLFPKTALGKLAAVLSITFIILIDLKILFPLTMQTFFIAALGLSGLIAGIIAIMKNE